MTKALYILLPVFNRRAITTKLAEALKRQVFQDFQLVLIDDGSTDGTSDAVRALLPETEVIRGEGDWWWAGSLEAGCEWLQAQALPGRTVVCFLNDDVEIAPDFTQLAIAEMGDESNILLLARQIDHSIGFDPKCVGGVHVDLERLTFEPAMDELEVNCLPTRGLFLRVEDLIRIGGFRPKFLPHYLSDYEYTIRASRKGFRLRVAKRLALVVKTESTGLEQSDIFTYPRGKRLGLIFSQRFKGNPRTFSAFVLAAVPWTAQPVLLLKIWFRFIRLLWRCWTQPNFK